jgi:hypothetical protein
LYYSCNYKNKRTKTKIEKDIIIDTLVFFEGFGKPGNISIEWENKSFDDAYPFNEWVQWKTFWKDEYVGLLSHCEVFMTSPDTNIHIRNISDTTFLVKVNSTYKGREYVNDRNQLSIAPALRPHKGYVFDAYWLDKPIKYPESTTILELTNVISWKK